MPRVTKTPDARRDIVGIADYLLQHSIDAAVRFLDAVEETCRTLADNPELGGLCHFEGFDLGAVRVWQVRGFPNHLIFYRAEAYGIDVLRVLHGARDTESILGGGP
jgi:toxin ParE1/3/4